MLCQNCGKNEANIRYTQIINGVKKEVHLCSECAKKMGMDSMEMPDLFNFNSFLGDFFNDYMEEELLPSFQTSEVKCKNCNMTYNDFIKTGMFGCSNCYETFTNPIDSLLKNLHGTAKHIGRIPKNEKAQIKLNKKTNKEEKNVKEDKLSKLQKDLDKAIKEERYEDAAKIRDEIKEMNK